MLKLTEFIQNFGFTNGVTNYLKLRYNRTRNVQVRGIKYPISLRPNKFDKYTFKEMFILRDYDIRLPASWGPPSVIIDAGANIGLSAVFFSSKYSDARIFAIEPSDDNYQCLVNNCKPYPNVVPLKSALWPVTETLHVINQGQGLRSYMVEPTQESDDQTALSAVSIRSLQNQFGFTTIDILKIDIEGSEKDLFENADHSWLANTKCLIIELHDRMKEGCSKVFFQAISQYDFSFSMKGENLIFINNNIQ
ncbi:FkbM family methyltransferase [Pseudobacter ginsenosidimutans]|uniref:FkbM family methyltransferase n=1 Tax=Pseudobacter ginsenosidimutans TaxID=661488 RepID=A0A4Q7MYJ5_9BACT|nr:FkbM family methyltransferase [Pseudobacter ginsenosidimutans]QEC41029.1 FkbM family methyltransferase [Pseudobacter ginsenosidimutans]RZS72220.1 FkbM family methyltransferase [Pseudobacter ginsenosidimutans]